MTPHRTIKKKTADTHENFIYLPLETKVRELTSKCLLALSLTNKGFSCILGKDEHIRAGLYSKTLPPGIYFDRSLAKNKRRIHRSVTKSGGIVAAQDEESGAIIDEINEFVQGRGDIECLKQATYLFTWGDHDHQAWKRLTTSNSPIRLIKSGSPRVDTWRLKCSDSRQNTILFCCNFAVSNHVSKKSKLERYQSLKKRGAQITSSWEHFEDYYESDKHYLQTFLRAISKISSTHPSTKILVRPHPVEDADYWRRRIGRLQNVEVDNSNDVGIDICRSNVVVHAGCTTGVEAFARGKTVIAIESFPSTRNHRLPNDLSIKAKNEHELEEYIANYFSRGIEEPKEAKEKKRLLLQARYENLKNTTPAAHEIISETLRAASGPPTRPRSFKAYRLLAPLLNLAFQTKKRFKGVKPEPKQKLPDLQTEEIQDHLNWLSDAFGLPQNRIAKISKDVFLLRRKDKQW